MRLCISEPVVVSRGPAFETTPWGVYQFPDLFHLPDGRIMCAFADSGDTIDAYGAERGCYVSSDWGKTWERARERDFDTVVGTELDNGDRVQFVEPDSIPVTEDMKFPKPYATNGNKKYYLAEDIDSSVCQNTWMIHRVNAEHPEGIQEPVKLNWPYRTISATDKYITPVMPWGRLRKAPDGALWMPDYAICPNPNNGGWIPEASNFLLKSTDHGKTWELKHFMPFVPDTSVLKDAYRLEGFNENDITFAPDGSYVRLVRTHRGNTNFLGPCFITRSTDKGETWSEPEVFDDRGVWPRLLTLKCGVTLASYGRPGFFVRATDDPACIKWEERIQLVGEERVYGKPVTCAYSDMIALDDHTAALAYTDFTVRDEQGVMRKTVLYRTITVEK